MPRKTVKVLGVSAHPVTASMRPRPDAAENLPKPTVKGTEAPGFNEAAARCRGKRPVRLRSGSQADQASMRPRPDAAENVLAQDMDERGQQASMRPRPDAAENKLARRVSVAGQDASMRPRPDAAEAWFQGHDH